MNSLSQRLQANLRDALRDAHLTGQTLLEARIRARLERIEALLQSAREADVRLPQIADTVMDFSQESAPQVHEVRQRLDGPDGRSLTRAERWRLQTALQQGSPSRRREAARWVRLALALARPRSSPPMPMVLPEGVVAGPYHRGSALNQAIHWLGTIDPGWVDDLLRREEHIAEIDQWLDLFRPPTRGTRARKPRQT